jgi:ubiquinone/menaquinone biosynthesis C-methylase UbiE
VVGVDYCATNVAQARVDAERQGLSERIEFYQGDAEQLITLPDESFDTVLCECAFCTFPNKHAAATEIARVLVPGGRFGLSDLVRNCALPPELDGLFGWIACIADAQPVAGYVAHLEAVGLKVQQVEAHNDALAELIRQVRERLFAADVVAKLQHLDLPDGLDLQHAKRLARSAAEAVDAGSLGYALIIASK